MAARVKISYVQLNDGRFGINGGSPILRKVISSLPLITVTTTATLAGSRPAAPAQADPDSPYYARVTAIDNPVLVAWDDTDANDPTASDASGPGVRIEAGSVELIPMIEGRKMSFIEVSDDSA